LVYQDAIEEEVYEADMSLIDEYKEEEEPMADP